MKCEDKLQANEYELQVINFQKHEVSLEGEG